LALPSFGITVLFAAVKPMKAPVWRWNMPRPRRGGVVFARPLTGRIAKTMTRRATE
jgi:hypothetical protein